MKEGQFNQRLVKRIRSYGLFAFKTSDRFKPGVPDIYIEGGNWIESKVIKLGSQNREVNLYNKLTPEQKTFGEELSVTNDKLILAFRLEFPDAKGIVFYPFRTVERENSVSNHKLRYFSNPIVKETEYPVDMLINYMGINK